MAPALQRDDVIRYNCSACNLLSRHPGVMAQPCSAWMTGIDASSTHSSRPEQAHGLVAIEQVEQRLQSFPARARKLGIVRQHQARIIAGGA